MNFSKIILHAAEPRLSPENEKKKKFSSKSWFGPGMWQLVNNFSMYFFIKYLLTAGIIVLVSEVAKRYDRIGAIIASLPLVTILVMIWMYVEKTPITKISNHAYYTFWYVIPTLPMFLIFPYLIERYGFWITLLISIALTVILFLVFAFLVKKIGIDLL